MGEGTCKLLLGTVIRRWVCPFHSVPLPEAGSAGQDSAVQCSVGVPAPSTMGALWFLVQVGGGADLRAVLNLKPKLSRVGSNK